MQPPNKHGFRKYCLDSDALVEGQTLRTYVRELGAQARLDEAAEVCHDRIHGKHASDREYSEQKYKSPIYFGEGGEFLRHCYFDFFGYEYDLKEVWSVNADDGAIPKDLGWDGGAVTTDGRHPVYFQDKTTEVHDKDYKMNDGSRVMNFAGSAAMHAIANENVDAERARFILWTTANGLDRSLLDRLHGKVEVVACESIAERVDGCESFWIKVARELSMGE